MEFYDPSPAHAVEDTEYLRLLGYPPGHEPGERVRELMAETREWYARNGRPWVYLREATLQNGPETLRLDGVEFQSHRLQEHFRRHDVRGAMLVAVSAGCECEERARQHWQEGRPDDYFFLEMFGSAVVEDLVARTSGRICDLAGPRQLMAVPHYSPGYSGWDVAEQGRLFGLIAGSVSRPLPGPIEVLSSGMLRPKKSLLGVFGLAPAGAAEPEPGLTPCANCAFSPCRYRRAPYGHGTDAAPAAAAAATPANYTTNLRALRKWAAERVGLKPQPDGTIEAVFRFDGTTCSNMGRPLAFDYRVVLDRDRRIVASACAPAAGDEGFQSTCAYLADPERFRQSIAGDRPLLGRPLDDVLGWARPTAPSGCHCHADSRLHKWGLALEAIHFTLNQSRQPVAVP